MRRKSNRYHMWYVVWTAMIFLCGCGSGTMGGQKAEEIKQEGITYVPQSLSLPEYVSFDAAFSDGYDLHYAATGFNQTSQQNETAFYTLKQGAAEPEMNFRLEENQRVQSMTMDVEGNIYYLGYEESIQKNGDDRIAPGLVLYKLNQKGVPLLTVNLEEYTGRQEPSIIQGLAVDDEERIALFASDQSVFVLNSDGGLLLKDRTAGKIYDICSSNGNIFVGYDDGNGMSVKEVDISGRELTEKLKYNIPGSQFYMSAGRNENLFIATEESVYEYALEGETLIKKFDWQAYDSTGIIAGILLPFGQNGVLAISRSYGTVPMKVEATAFQDAAGGEAAVQDKTVLILGVSSSLPAGLSAEVVYFNKANPDVKIEVKNYEEDYTRLNAEIIAGKGPDLLVLFSDRMNQFAERGVLEDLNLYFDEDETLERSDFLENILGAFEMEGHLYGMPVNFTISTVVGKTSVLGERSGWNMEELIDFAESFPEGTGVFDNSSKSGVLRLLKYAYLRQLVDADNADAPLDRELLVKMLRFADQYENDDQYIYDTDLAGKVMEEQVLLDTGVFSGHDYYGRSGLFGEPVTYIGYPVAEGNGNLIRSPYTFAINSGSGYKDIAWKFISTLLSEEVQMRMEKDYSTKGFHIRKDALEYHLTWVRENTSAYLMTAGGSYAEYRFNPGDLREEDIEPVRSLIQKADKAVYVLPDIDRIIEEEAIFYFDGTKPVEEVVDIIENRVRTYVNEMK